MTLSILGSGNIGSALAGHFAQKNIPVSIANNRGPASLEPLCKKLGSSITAVELAGALQADIVILALPFTAVAQLGDKTDWATRIVIDATNAIDFPAFTPTDLGGKLSSEVVAEYLLGARVVKASTHFLQQFSLRPRKRALAGVSSSCRVMMLKRVLR